MSKLYVYEIDNTIVQRIVKLQEEVGEVASAYNKNDLGNMKEEVLDCIQVLIGLADELEINSGDILEHNRKLALRNMKIIKEMKIKS